MILFLLPPRVVANEDLESARTYMYLDQAPLDRQLYIPSERCGVKTSDENTFRTHLLTFWGRAE